MSNAKHIQNYIDAKEGKNKGPLKTLVSAIKKSLTLFPLDKSIPKIPMSPIQPKRNAAHSLIN